MKFFSLVFLFSIILLISQCKNSSEQVNTEAILKEYITDTLVIKDTIELIDTVYNDMPKYLGKGKGRFSTLGYSSASIQNLYYKCGNTFSLDMPVDWGKSVVKASSASVLVSKTDDRKITVVPSGKTSIVSVAVNHGGMIKKINDIKFKVILPPRPTIQLIVDGKEYNGSSIVSKKSRFIVKLNPNRDFVSNLPRDARYMISSVDVFSQRSLGAPTKIASFNGSGKDATKGITMNLFSKLKADSPGTKIYFKINKIYRTNFQNKKIEEKFPSSYLWLGALIK